VRTETFPTTRPLVVTVKLPRGEVTVETADVQEATVVLDGSSERAREQIERSEITFSNRGDHDELLIDADPEDFGWSAGRVKLSISLGSRRDKVSVKLIVPHGTTLNTETGSGDVHAKGRYAAVDARTGAGDISIDEVEQDAAIKVASGDVHLMRVGGKLKAQTAAGDLKVGPVGGDAEVKSAAGDISLDEVGGSATVHTASGDLRLGAVTEGKVELKSVSGDMLVGVRRGSRVWMDVKTVTGDARSELDSGDDDGEGPLVELKATAMSGYIRIVRA
jgi:DUF4097 and DUF4098 domain-containing protein YvlB